MGVFRWSIELVSIDINTEIVMILRYLATPRRGNLEQTFHIFAYMDKADRSKIVFDSYNPEIPESSFLKAYWKDLYPDAEEPTSPHAPEAQGNGVHLHWFFDSDHSRDKVTIISHTGVLIFLNRAPIMCYSQ